MTAAADTLIRLALAGEAYRSDTVRLVEPELAGCSHLVATRHGLFATDGHDLRLIAYGLFYGLTVAGDDILAFEACDRPRHTTARGRIVRFRRSGTRIVGTRVLARGLDNGCHQIDLIHGALCVVDTYNQRVLRFALEGGEPEALYPLPRAAANDWAGGYVHLNSLIADGDEILLLLHNGADKTGRPSAIARFDRAWRRTGTIPLDGLGCHSFARLEDGAILSCGSFAGELIATDGLRVAVCDLMTRGLSVDDQRVAVGGSAFADRDSRDDALGALFFLDRDYRLLSRVDMPAPVMEIRRIDGRDRSLSGYAG